MWCINLGNLASGILWFLVVIVSIIVVYLIFTTRDTDYWQRKLRNRVSSNEMDINGLKVDVNFLNRHKMSELGKMKKK